MPDVVGALGGVEEADGGGDQLADVIEAAGARRAQEGFQLREGLFDRVEVGAIGRKKADGGPGPRDGGANLRLFGSKLSSTTTSPGRNVGASTCST